MRPERREVLPRPTDRLALGHSGLRASPICLGKTGSPDTVLAAFEAGINFFFLSADLHWPMYEPLRRGLAQLCARGPSTRDELVVAAASYVTQPEFCGSALREACEAVPGLGRIDVAILGGVYPDEYPRRLAIYRRLRDVRAVGATFHDRPTAAHAVKQAEVDVAFARYNAAHRGAREDVFPHLDGDRSTPLYNFKSAAAWLDRGGFGKLGLEQDGNWHPSPADHYRYVLTRPAVDGILCALDGPHQLAALLAALAEGGLSAEEEAYIDQVTDLAERHRLLS